MLRIDLAPSKYLAATLVAVHTGSVLVLIPLAMPLLSKLTIAIAVGATLARALRSAALLRSRISIVALEFHEENLVALRTREGRWHTARILGTTFVSPLVTVLNLRVAGRRLVQHVVIVRDSVGAEDFRRLRVLLRWGYRKNS